MSAARRPAVVQACLPRLVAIWLRTAALPTMFCRWLATCLLAALLPALAHAASQARAPMTLEDAVTQVQQDTGGKILSADARKFGRRTEYRIKVLTPEGHVRTISISSDAPHAGTGKHPAGNGAGKKEKH